MSSSAAPIAESELQRRMLEQMRLAAQQNQAISRSGNATRMFDVEGPQSESARLGTAMMALPAAIGATQLQGLAELYNDPSRLIDRTPVAGTIKRGAELTGDVMAGRVDPRSEAGIQRIAGTAADVVTEGGSAQVRPGEVAFGSGRTGGPSEHSALLAKLREVYGKQQTTRPFPQAMVEPTTTMIPERDIDIASLEGKVAIPWQGDRTAAGQRITGLDNQKFDEPVYQYGGPGFARAEAAQGPDKAAWASTPTATTTLHNRMDKVASHTGKDPVGVYVPGSEKSSDFSLQGWNLLDQMIKQGKHDPAKLAKLYEGLQMGEGLLPWAQAAKGTPRSTAFKKFDTVNRARDLNITPGDVRLLLSDPALLGAPQGEVGHMFALPEGRLIRDPSIKHPDYASQIGGTYFGQFPKGSEVPREVFFADAYRRNPSLGKMDPQAVEQTFKTQLPYQIIDAETVDRVSRFQEEKRKRGR